MKAEASTPSIGRSLGTRFDAPAIPASVGSQSTAASISFVTTPAGTLAGQRMMAGTRMLDRVQDLTDAVVHFAYEVGKQPTTLDGLAGEIRIRDEGWVHLGVADINKERLFRRRVSFDVIHCLRDDVFLVYDRS